ncbi:GDSL-type esterase/lipase family protein [Paracraurococcus lichenis]|uniref:GDSL-type esterase/lipase family protein n=1 Tax=Paracraurococcus lichenis TaxID=3064888 RepID=A0ABT9DTW0_9PROT|nr:GDSL-type esterase/lipase family protein [Paracraurococcus sp. LOR1-02]MDO9707331.1 GDSL-type esterase/lipase family protein [Paracraurococcus sp. LOR1-02]
MSRDLRICFVGDSFVAGAGDETALGWVGRVTASAWHRGVGLTAYNLGVRRDTSADLRRRAEAEVLARLLGAGDAQAVVFSFGANDCTLEDEMPRVPPEVTEENAAALLGWAAARWPVLMVGPPPLAHDAGHDARVAALSDRLGGLCAALDVPFLATHAPLSAGNAWRSAAARGDGVHPDAAGYAALAALVEAWQPWRDLTGG